MTARPSSSDPFSPNFSITKPTPGRMDGPSSRLAYANVGLAEAWKKRVLQEDRAMLTFIRQCQSEYQQFQDLAETTGQTAESLLDVGTTRSLLNMKTSILPHLIPENTPEDFMTSSRLQSSAQSSTSCSDSIPEVDTALKFHRGHFGPQRRFTGGSVTKTASNSEVGEAITRVAHEEDEAVRIAKELLRDFQVDDDDSDADDDTVKHLDDDGTDTASVASSKLSSIVREETRKSHDDAVSVTSSRASATKPSQAKSVSSFRSRSSRRSQRTTSTRASSRRSAATDISKSIQTPPGGTPLHKLRMSQLAKVNASLTGSENPLSEALLNAHRDSDAGSAPPSVVSYGSAGRSDGARASPSAPVAVPKIEVAKSRPKTAKPIQFAGVDPDVVSITSREGRSAGAKAPEAGMEDRVARLEKMLEEERDRRRFVEEKYLELSEMFSGRGDHE